MTDKRIKIEGIDFVASNQGDEYENVDDVFDEFVPILIENTVQTNASLIVPAVKNDNEDRYKQLVAVGLYSFVYFQKTVCFQTNGGMIPFEPSMFSNLIFRIFNEDINVEDEILANAELKKDKHYVLEGTRVSMVSSIYLQLIAKTISKRFDPTVQKTHRGKLLVYRGPLRRFFYISYAFSHFERAIASVKIPEFQIRKYDITEDGKRRRETGRTTFALSMDKTQVVLGVNSVDSTENVLSFLNDIANHGDSILSKAVLVSDEAKIIVVKYESASPQFHHSFFTFQQQPGYSAFYANSMPIDVLVVYVKRSKSGLYLKATKGDKGREVVKDVVVSRESSVGEFIKRRMTHKKCELIRTLAYDDSVGSRKYCDRKFMNSDEFELIDGATPMHEVVLRIKEINFVVYAEWL
jgi:hypothetical protein